jgi:hypothetical protein
MKYAPLVYGQKSRAERSDVELRSNSSRTKAS